MLDLLLLLYGLMQSVEAVENEIDLSANAIKSSTIGSVNGKRTLKPKINGIDG